MEKKHRVRLSHLYSDKSDLSLQCRVLPSLPHYSQPFDHRDTSRYLDCSAADLRSRSSTVTINIEEEANSSTYASIPEDVLPAAFQKVTLRQPSLFCLSTDDLRSSMTWSSSASLEAAAQIKSVYQPLALDMQKREDDSSPGFDYIDAPANLVINP